MASINLYTYTLLVLFVFSNLPGYSNNKDTTIVSHWRDGSKKTVSIYKLKRTKDKTGKTITVLKKLKDVKYYKPDCETYYDEDWDDHDKCELSKKDFDFSYSIYNKMDSIQEAMRKRPRIKRKNVITIRLGYQNSRLNFPMNINIGDTGLFTYKKRDTILIGKTYPFQVFIKDTFSSPHDFKFFAALRTDTFKIYFFETNSQNEVLKADIEAMAKEAGIKILNTTGVITEATITTASAVLKEAKTGATKGLTFILANLILLQK